MHSFTVFYVCGLDHAKKCGLQNGFGKPNQGVVIVPRSNMPPAASKPDLLVFGVTEINAEVEHLSSTVVRRALKDGKPIDPSWMSEPVATELCRIYAHQSAPSRSLASKASPRVVFVSLSIIMREVPPIPMDVLEDSLFFFGSKRMWIWPSDDAAKAEAAQQPGGYADMPGWLRELLARKEARGEVCFLKPDVLGPPDEVVFGDYAAASAWLARLTDPRTGAPYGPLRLEPEWWEQSFAGGQFVARERWRSVVENFQEGLHSYNEVARARESPPCGGGGAGGWAPCAQHPAAPHPHARRAGRAQTRGGDGVRLRGGGGLLTGSTRWAVGTSPSYSCWPWNRAVSPPGIARFRRVPRRTCGSRGATA